MRHFLREKAGCTGLCSSTRVIASSCVQQSSFAAKGSYFVEKAFNARKYSASAKLPRHFYMLTNAELDKSNVNDRTNDEVLRRLLIDQQVQLLLSRGDCVGLIPGRGGANRITGNHDFDTAVPRASARRVVRK